MLVLKVNNTDYDLIKQYLPKEKWEKAFKKLDEDYPVQYIIGNVEFYNCLINVNENVLIPRFETEYLVDDIIKYVKEYHFDNPSIIDICTGSGAIAISLNKNINSNVDAIDISAEAINVAIQNNDQNKTNVSFKVESIEEFNINKKYDILVSNPPYVRCDEYVDPKTKYEPQIAIFAPSDELYFYKLILKKSLNLLNKKSIIAFEIGSKQGDELKKIAYTYYPTAKIILKNDLNNLNRYLYIINE